MQCIHIEGQAVQAQGLKLHDPEAEGTNILHNTGNMPAGKEIHVTLLMKRWMEWVY
jgi:hypothetical protein